MANYKDKVAIVTGGSSGIGRALCEELGRRGATVIVADKNDKYAVKIASGITKTGGRGTAIRVDVSKEEEVQRLINGAAAEYGRLDYMFNNAGISVGGEVRDISTEHWRRVIGVNLWGVIYGTTAAYSLMVKQGFGQIVNTSSLTGLICSPMNAPYATTKHAVVGLSTSLRAEAAGLGVKVNVVCPGYIRTGIFDASPVLNVDHDKAVALIRFKMMDAAEAARVMLRGVERNKAIITFPLYARLVWWIYRLNQIFLLPSGRKMVKDFRSFRIKK